MVFVVSLFSVGDAMEHSLHKDKSAIVLAFFGTTYPSGVSAIKNIVDEVKEAFPHTEVRVTFTSNIIKSIWRKRQQEAEKWLNAGVPQEVLYVKGLIATLGELADEGYKNIVVQPTHIYHMEEVEDLYRKVHALQCIETVKEKWKPFKKIAMGRPLLGGIGDKHDYHEDIKKVVLALRDDVNLAREKGAVLVYMGHGNEFWSTGIYVELQKAFREVYPDVQVFVGTVEGYPSLEDVVEQLKKEAKSKKIVLKPFMIVAGDHATNDMAGDDPDSWKNVLKKEGFEVYPILEGLGEKDAVAGILVGHIRDAAKEAGLKLE